MTSLESLVLQENCGEVASNFIQNLSEIFSRPGVRRMNPPRCALYSRYAVFGMHCCWGSWGCAIRSFPAGPPQSLANRNVASNLTAQARPAEHYGKETII